MLKVADIFEAISGQFPSGAEQPITGAIHDSRNAQSGNLFVAMKGEHTDGHDFVAEAFSKGAILALVQREIAGNFPILDLRAGRHITDFKAQYPLCLLVDDCLLALQKSASFWRRKLNLRVIGITGSVGKTTTKELTAEVLFQHYLTFKSAANFNNEIGLPLNVLSITERHERAVLEMGFYVPGEIALLADIALPVIGVITNIGTVHAERAGSQEAIYSGKAELVRALPKDGTAILNLDDPLVRRMAQESQARVFWYGLDSESDLWADEIEGMGLDRFPELRRDYFGNYTRAVYLPQRDDLALRARARWAADTLGLPLEVRPAGHGALESRLMELMQPLAVNSVPSVASTDQDR